MDLKIIKSDFNNLDFINLVEELDFHLIDFYGKEQGFFVKKNQIDKIKYVVLIYVDDNPVACGGIKEFSESTMEIKRMYVKPEFRGLGLATMILASLEGWTLDLGYNNCVLETMKVKESVIRLYTKNGFNIIENYGDYENIEKSVCMLKILK